MRILCVCACACVRACLRACVCECVHVRVPLRACAEFPTSWSGVARHSLPFLVAKHDANYGPARLF